MSEWKRGMGEEEEEDGEGGRRTELALHAEGGFADAWGFDGFGGEGGEAWSCGKGG